MRDTPTGSGPQHREQSIRVTPKSSGSQYVEPSVRVTPRPTASGGGNPYDRGNGQLPAHRESTVRMTPKATSGDKERPVHVTVNRARPIVSATREKFQARNAKDMV